MIATMAIVVSVVVASTKAPATNNNIAIYYEYITNIISPLR